MKTIRITLKKDGVTATCTHKYRDTDWPAETVWSGNRHAFALSDGRPPSMTSGIDTLERAVAFQAAQSGATYKIEDLGGEAEMWKDNIILKADG